MKPTININLAGYPFTIDEDAYKLLKDYLDTIRYAFVTPDDTEDIATDIESRIAELLIEKENGGIRIVTLEEISQVINRIGKPSDFIEIEETEKFSDSDKNNDSGHKESIRIEERITPPPYNPNRNYGGTLQKKLFRDPQNAMIAGVCSGLAAYLNIDVTIIRILTVILIFLSASTVVIAYIILWIIVPEATTPLQRMQMTGQDPTMENIGKTVTENFHEEGNPKETEANSKSGFNRFMSSVFSIFIKCVVILSFIIGFPILLALLLVLLACIIAFFAGGTALLGGSIFGDSLNFQAPGGGVLAFYLLLASIGAIITLGIPFWLLIRMAFRKNKENLSQNNRRSLLIIWLAGIALTAVFTVRSVKQTKRINRSEWGVNIEKLQELNNIDKRDIEDIDLNNGTVTMRTTDGTTYTISKGKVHVEKNELTDSIEKGDTILFESLSSVTVEETVNTDTITSIP